MGRRNIRLPAQLQIPGSIVDLPNGAQRLRRTPELLLELIQAIATLHAAAKMQGVHPLGFQANDGIPDQPGGETATALRATVDMVFRLVTRNDEYGYRLDRIRKAPTQHDG